MTVMALHRETPTDGKEILDKVGDISGIELFGPRVLVAIYVRPQRTSGGIIRPDSNLNEDIYQGKIGLVLKVGPGAFVDRDGWWFGDTKVQAGDWIGFRVSDGSALTVNTVPCRILDDVKVHCKASRPDLIW